MLYDKIRAICKEKQISVHRMEGELGVPHATICKWNENEPGIRKVQKVAKYLGVSIEELLEPDQVQVGGK